MIMSRISADRIDSGYDFLSKEELASQPAADRVDDRHHAALGKIYFSNLSVVCVLYSSSCLKSPQFSHPFEFRHWVRKGVLGLRS